MQNRHRTGNSVPDWARDAIWYQIFPERFRNGEPNNDPCPGDIATGSVPGWRVSPWGMDWYRQAAWERKLGPFYRSVYLRRYGGDLIGVREKLDYLQDLGVNAIYLNPIFMARSLHKYDGSCFHHIDPTFGPDREGDLRAIREAQETDDPTTWIWTAADRYFLDLVRDIHARGMRIIIDGVFNHTGTAFFAFQDILQNGRASRYRDWYRIQRWHKNGTFKYRGWFNHVALPELARTRDNLVRPVRDYIFHITRRWMDPDGDGDPSDGIDGWRLDVAFCVPHGFWKEWRRLVKSINPEAYLTGEIVTLAGPWLRGDEFDAVMNYMWLYPSVDFFAPGRKPISSALFRKRLDVIRRAYPADVWHVLQNLLDSHDVARIASMLENPDVPKRSWEDYFNASRVKNNGGFKATKPGERAWAALRQLAIFQVTYPGAPMIYYGTEVGMWGANDPDNRQPMLWDDIRYEPETITANGPCPVGIRNPDKALFRFFQRAFELRRKHIALRRGEFRWLKSGHERLLVFKRMHKDEEVIVALNASDAPLTYRLGKRSRDVWDDGVDHDPGPLEIPPRGWKVLKSSGC